MNQIKNMEVRICRFKQQLFELIYGLVGTRSVVLLGRPLKKMHSSRVKKCRMIREGGDYEGKEKEKE